MYSKKATKPSFIRGLGIDFARLCLCLKQGVRLCVHLLPEGRL